jgi:hypothetical protein
MFGNTYVEINSVEISSLDASLETHWQMLVTVFISKLDIPSQRSFGSNFIQCLAGKRLIYNELTNLRDERRAILR